MDGLLLPKKLRRRLWSLFKSPMFWLISFWGNFCIVSGAVMFYEIEFGINPRLNSMLDSLEWAVGIVTTVGGSDIHPITVAGKILAIIMMMGGAVFLWSYMALFIGILVEPELGAIQREVSELLSHEIHEDEQILARLKSVVSALESRKR